MELLDNEKRKNQILKLVEEMIKDDRQATALALMHAGLQCIAEEYPAENSQADIALIKSNYPKATSKSIKERSMAPGGVNTTIATCKVLLDIALDYSPLSHVSDVMEKDFSNPEMMESLQNVIGDTYIKCIESGISAFGASSMMIIMGAEMGIHAGANMYQITRPIKDALGRIAETSSDKFERDKKLRESQAIDMISMQLGVSKKTAKKYVDHYNEIAEKDKKKPK
ncbi:hypothetical protein HNP46_006102 [Pseudomonas nitritireducens]|uniref:Uncharacterized protein n=1 Tax=Pseudomonas nitroreducens TaxID=46680 RepID=A0A7W7KQU0_PSENT|nr:hypothetical protein [Pseudomonas nitritireducens]MBB4867191.1 hypothetical protein [Pseudomonas nitritireducens]